MGETAIDKDALRERVIDVLKGVYDPEIPVSIWELGLVYGIEVGDEGQVKVVMTLTTPHCPEAQSMPIQIEEETKILDGVSSVEVEVTWDPPWGPDKMSEAARLALGF